MRSSLQQYQLAVKETALTKNKIDLNQMALFKRNARKRRTKV